MSSAQTQGDTTVYDSLALTEQPHRIHFPAPAYPRQLQFAGIGGQVLVTAIIGPDGRVERNSVKVLVTSDSLFVPPTVDAVRHARFTPGKINGRAVRARTTFPLRYVACPAQDGDTIWIRPGQPLPPRLPPPRPCR